MSIGFVGIGYRAVAILGGGGSVPMFRARDGKRTTGGRCGMNLGDDVTQLTVAAHPTIDTLSSQTPTSAMRTPIT